MVGQPGPSDSENVSSDDAAHAPQEPNDGGVMHDPGLRKWTLEAMGV